MVVLLFTDVESSTRLWEQHPAAMRGALALHDEILRDAIAARSGAVVKSTGDGLLATFPTVTDGIGAALAMQRRLGASEWGMPEPLRVRIGIHVGEAEARGGDLYGTAVNRAARIMAAAHGGQVLISGRAADLLEAGPPEGVGLRDLGSHRLKDLTASEQLYQLTHADLQSDFPPLATVDARPNNLPRQASEFFGREAELATTRRLVEHPDVRLVTLLGPGGSGKTRLALQAAAELIERFRDGVYFVDLSAERDPESVFEAIVRELGLSTARAGSPLQVLKARLRERDMLLVLDNFEQVTDAALGLAELLDACPDLVVLATSRETLRLRAEHVVPVPPLSLPDPRASLAAIADSEAVSLFVARARAVRPDFELTEGSAAAVAEIARRLDGLPLAIELAAARLKVFSATDLLERLRRRVDALGSGARDLPTRQRTLRGTIAWSYELLDEGECRVFELLSVFSSARLEAVEAVAAAVYAEVDAVDVVASLVDKSLLRGVEQGGSQRFAMLNTVREFARERLDASPEAAAAVERAHAVHFAEHAGALRSSLRGRGRDAALEDLSAELAELRTAWRYWVAAGDRERLDLLVDGLWALHEARGWYHGAIDLANDLLGGLAATPPSAERDEEEMTLRASRGRALMALHGYTPEVEVEFARAVELSRSTEAAGHRFPALRALASYYMNVSEFEKAAALGEQLLQLAEREDDDAIRIEGHLVFGLNTAFGGDTDAGLRHLERVIELFDPERPGAGSARFRIGNEPGVVARVASGLLLRDRGFPERAAARVDDAVALAKRLQNPFTLAYALYHSGFLALNRHRPEEAIRCAAELGAIAHEHDYLVWQALSSVVHGAALCALGRAEEGIAMTEAGFDLYRGLTTPPVFWPFLLGLIASASLMAGDTRRALELVDEAMATFDPEGPMPPELLTVRGDALLAASEAEGAAAAYRAAAEGARALGSATTELVARTRLLEVERERGGPADDTTLRALYETFGEGLHEHELVAARRALGMDASPPN